MRFEESAVTLRVRPNDLDSLGHVNNATALEYLEAGRWAWLDQHALRRTARVLPVVAKIEVSYRREILPQEVVVHTRVESPRSDELEEESVIYRASFRQQILIDGSAQVAVDALVQVAFIDVAERSLRSLQDFLASARNRP
ncbi:acyl-CoA thioesterase [Hyalangium rubrum]|uniref:Acyl-CoA thioesterase n=1 Tax=Hyalangium rubrum TaxID=3103134 RepID=A0ABU5H1A9_9BACT|nr:acyl-CoA thioesterase [Hyalangium sp. s54d21]MDY7227239.1 acyl-CoA thioesterase [Hyalangium sp. s54d21]